MRKLLIFTVFLLTSHFMMGQEEMKPEKWEDVSWQVVEMVKFKSGTMDEVKDIIEKYEAAADPDNMPELHWFVFGDWDMMIIWTLKDGPSMLEWKRSQSSIDWYQRFIDQQGGMDEAKKLFEAYDEAVLDSKSFMTRKMEK